MIDKAVEVLKRGGVVVYPTDTAYGLAVDATNEKAVKKLYRLKGRNFKNPIHVILPHLLTGPYGSIIEINASTKKLIKKFFPGPITLVLPLKARGKSWQLLSAGTKNLGIRLPKNKIALQLAKKFGKPITATSANIAGKDNTYSTLEVRKQFQKSKKKPDFYLDGGRLVKRKPSTVVLLTTKDAKILREGPISKKQIDKVLRN